MAVLGISKYRTNTVTKVILQGEVPRKKRGGDHATNKHANKKVSSEFH